MVEVENLTVFRNYLTTWAVIVKIGQSKIVITTLFAMYPQDYYLIIKMFFFNRKTFRNLINMII